MHVRLTCLLNYYLLTYILCMTERTRNVLVREVLRIKVRIRQNGSRQQLHNLLTVLQQITRGITVKLLSGLRLRSTVTFK